MKKRYKHTGRYTSKKKNKFKVFAIKSAIAFVILLTVFFASDRIASFKQYVINTINKSYTVSDLRELKDKTVDSAEEIREAMAVFNEYKSDNNPPQPTKITFRPPYIGEITSVYGEREHPVDKESSFHTGIDIAGNMGDTVISAAEGTVTKVGYDEINGNHLCIKHTDKFSTSYAHLSKISVVEGEKVDSNTKIGEIGNSGVSTGAHLHFCIFEDGKTIDPEIYVKLNHREQK